MEVNALIAGIVVESVSVEWCWCAAAARSLPASPPGPGCCCKQRGHIDCWCDRVIVVDWWCVVQRARGAHASGQAEREAAHRSDHEFDAHANSLHGTACMVACQQKGGACGRGLP